MRTDAREFTPYLPAHILDILPPEDSVIVRFAEAVEKESRSRGDKSFQTGGLNGQIRAPVVPSK